MNNRSVTYTDREKLNRYVVSVCVSVSGCVCVCLSVCACVCMCACVQETERLNTLEKQQLVLRKHCVKVQCVMMLF